MLILTAELVQNFAVGKKELKNGFVLFPVLLHQNVWQKLIWMLYIYMLVTRAGEGCPDQEKAQRKVFMGLPCFLPPVGEVNAS